MELTKDELLMLRDALNARITGLVDANEGSKRYQKAHDMAVLRDRVQEAMDKP